MSYLCNRNRETKIANDKVPWMSGLVSGLQNRVRRFESARNLQKQERRCVKMRTFFFYAQSPDFHKQGLCYYLKILYL
jgi:hypothetical protein